MHNDDYENNGGFEFGPGGAAVPGGGDAGRSPPGPIDVRPGLAWEQRAELGPGAAMLHTIRQVDFSPTVAFAAMRREGGWGEPLGFAVLAGSIFAWVGQAWNMLTRSMMGGLMGGAPGFDTQAIATANAQEVWVALVTPLVVVAWTFVVAAVFHLLLTLFGGAPHPYEATFRVVCYSWAATVFQVLPICGAFIGFVWGIVVMIIGLREAQGVPGGRAAAAVLVPVVFFCLCLGMAMILVAGTLVGLAQMGM